MSLKKIGPGCYANQENQLHVSIPELLEHFGWPDTEENRDRMEKLVSEVFSEIAPMTPQQVVD